jgi:hypothetical protein
MKVNAFIWILLIAVAVTGCDNIDNGTPECIVKEIKKFSREHGCDDRSVAEYEFQGKTVYVFSPGTCGADMTSNVFNSGCTLLGTLGGITGNGEINGQNFYTNAVFIHTTWAK